MYGGDTLRGLHGLPSYLGGNGVGPSKVVHNLVLPEVVVDGGLSLQGPDEVRVGRVEVLGLWREREVWEGSWRVGGREKKNYFKSSFV